MRRSSIEYVNVGHVKLPKDLAEEVQMLLRDPRTGRTSYGKMRSLCFILFTNWVEEQRTHRTEIPDLE